MKPFRTLSICISLAVAGCAGTSVPPGPSVANPAAQTVVSKPGSTAPTRVKHDNASYKRALYVADSTSNTIRIFTDTYYRQLGTITNGISYPNDLSMDQFGNLYVANFVNGQGGNVAVYAPGGTSPSFTYNAGMAGPTAVTVDRHGNVFEADAYTYINQYFHGVNAVTLQCLAPASTVFAVGLAVDREGDVFATYLVNSAQAIYEYKGGLTGCNPTLLYSGSAGRLALDSNDDLIFCDPGSGTVYVMDPPYTSISRTIGSGFSSPNSVSLNKKNKLAFVADSVNGNVTVINYQTGANVKVLGGSYGITNAWAAVDGPNAVY